MRSKLRLAFVTTYPPDRGNLAEYGAYLTRALAAHPAVEHVSVLANVLPGQRDEETLNPKLSLHRVWAQNDPSSISALSTVAKQFDPHVVHINCGIRTWGVSRRANLAGAALPALLRARGLKAAATLHTIGDTVRLDQHGVSGVTRLGISMASWMYLQSNLVTVTLESMRRVLHDRFRARNVVHVAHGTYGPRVAAPPTPDRLRILTFGFWGAFKDADLLVRSTEQLRARGIDVELVLGGGAHPYFPDIYARLKDKYGALPYVKMTGYVPEEGLQALFTSASVVVLPYRTNAGASGVLNLCRSYGRPVVVSNEPGLLEQLGVEGGRALVFDSDQSLTQQLLQLLCDPALMKEMGQANLDVARHLTIETQANLFVQHFQELVV